MTPKRLLLTLGGLAIIAVLLVGLLELKGSSPSGGDEAPLKLTRAQMQGRLAGAPAPLEQLHGQAGMLLAGGTRTVRARLAALHGLPVVVNKWASWCAPCRAEFGFFQRASLNLGRRVAFIGINSGDSTRSDAAAFLRSFPVSYPSYYDPGGQLGEAVTDSSFIPVTMFIPPRGRPYIHQGAYPSLAKLESDIRRYALPS